MVQFRQRNCVFYLAKSNETIPHLMAKNKVDVGIRAVTFSYHSADSPMEFSNPVSLYSFIVSQFLNEPTATRSDLISFLIDNRLLIIYVLIGCLVPLIAVCAFFRRRLRVPCSIRSLGTIAPRLLSLPYSRVLAMSSKLALIFVFFNFFLFFMRSTLTSLIKTNAIVLDTSQFINTRQRLFGSPKTMMVCGNPLESSLESKNPMEQCSGQSFTDKLFSEKMKRDRLVEVCFSKKGFKRLVSEAKENGLPSLLFWMDRVHAIWYLSSFSSFSTGKASRSGKLFIFIGRESYREDIVTLAMRRNLQRDLKRKALRR